MTPTESKNISSPAMAGVVDTPGCGDVFCAATAAKLSEGTEPFAAAGFGLKLASEAATARGVEEIFDRIRLEKVK